MTSEERETPQFQFEGAVLGIDHGMQFIGLAISRTGNFADPLMVIKRKSKQQDFAKINEVIAREKITAIVLGLPPKPPNFEGHAQADSVRSWAQHLYEAVTVPIYFWDEGLSSYDARDQLADVGKSAERVDAHAAAVILQQCLDALRDGHPAPEQFKLESG
ncbi:MAG TPA: Holliday junction resolvase RuvX [Aggregatilineales bacterium]|nr:Holliday junction resolvase RuvX [Aggregatilineales bacterium]